MLKLDHVIQSFNPTLVRFCHTQKRWKSGYKRSFNPTLVRFCRDRMWDVYYLLVVSIPPWFDFALDDSTITPEEALVSIPPWFDFAAPMDSIDTRVRSRFNPTLVRFCRRSPLAQAPCVAVSIPPWFDFAASARGVPCSVCSVSIPPWFDFAARVSKGECAT